MRSPRVLLVLLLVLGLMAAACGGGGGGETSAPGGESVDESPDTVEESTTTAAAGDAGQGSVSDFSAMPDECVDAFVEYLRVIEPSMEDFDFQNATGDEVDALFNDLQSVTADYEAQIADLDCPEVDAEQGEAFAEMIAIAEREAPGTVAYLRLIETISTSVGGGAEVSGDCESNIAALQEYVDRGGTMSDLTMEEFNQVLPLVNVITVQCSLDRVDEYFSQEDVAAFMESGG